MSAENIREDLLNPSRWVTAWEEADHFDREIAIYSLFLVAIGYWSIFQKFREPRKVSLAYATCLGLISNVFFRMGFNFSGIEYAAEAFSFVILALIGPGRRKG